MTLKELSALKLSSDRKRYPSVPTHGVAIKLYSDKTANGLATAIKDFCELVGVMCTRTGSEGRFRPGKTLVDVVGRTRLMKGTWLPGQNVGQGDLQVVMRGRIYSIEIKIGRDKQSEVQKEFQGRLEKAGGIYVIVGSWEEFYKHYSKWKI